MPFFWKNNKDGTDTEKDKYTTSTNNNIDEENIKEDNIIKNNMKLSMII